MSNKLRVLIIPKSLWRAGNNQHRLVFGVRDGKVFYGSRGGNVMNEFTQGEKCNMDAFLQVCNFIKNISDEEWLQARCDLKGWVERNRL